MLKARIATASLLLAALLAALFYLPDLGWGALMLSLMLVGAWEWAHICRFPTVFAGIYVALSAALAVASAGPVSSLLWLGAAAAFWCLVVPAWLHFKWRASPAWVAGIVGWLVLIPTWLAMVSLRDAGAAFLLVLLAIVWIADSSAYFFGKRYGRHKLAPAISPGKTWEGVLGALFTVGVYAALVVFLVPHTVMAPLGRLTVLLPAFFGIVALSVVGDLFESLMKRQAGLKDSGRLLPGHGGVLDRIDGLTSTLPLAALVAALNQVVPS